LVCLLGELYAIHYGNFQLYWHCCSQHALPVSRCPQTDKPKCDTVTLNGKTIGETITDFKEVISIYFSGWSFKFNVP